MIPDVLAFPVRFQFVPETVPSIATSNPPVPRKIPRGVTKVGVELIPRAAAIRMSLATRSSASSPSRHFYELREIAYTDNSRHAEPIPS